MPMKFIFFLIFFFVSISLQQGDLESLFKILDTNQDGVIDPKEMYDTWEVDQPKSPNTLESLSKKYLTQIFGTNSVPFSKFYRILNHLQGPPSSTKPQQRQIAFTGTPSELYIMWATKKPTLTSIVEYGFQRDLLTESKDGRNFTYTLPYPHDTDTWIHLVKLTQLRPDVLYFYRVGDRVISDFSDISTFKYKTKYPVSIGIYGDMGVLPWGWLVSRFIASSHQQRPLDATIVLGDIAYADFGSNGKRELQVLWDIYQRQVEPWAKDGPFMVVSGNHEQFSNYTAYQNRFHMPRNGNGNQYYSFDYGGAHFIQMNTESIYDSFEPGSLQYKWLEEDLRKAEENRRLVPWIIFSGHRPMYELGRTERQRFIEPLLVKYKVDLGLWGHIHCYYRSHPVINEEPILEGLETLGDSNNNIYRNPKAPIHVMVGTGGAMIYNDEMCGHTRPRHIGFMQNVYGFGRLNLINRTTIHFEFHKWATGKLEDEMWIIKDNSPNQN